MRRGDLQQHCKNGPGYYARRATHGVLQPLLFSASKFHLTQRKSLPSNSMSGGDGSTPCSRGSLASSGNQSRSKAICASAGSPRDSPREHRAPGLASPFLAGPGPARFSCLRRALQAGAREPGRAERPLRQPGRSEPSPAESLTGRRAHERPEQRVGPVPSGVGNHSKSSKKYTANGAAELPSALLPLGSGAEPPV